ncbi:gamma-glutamyltranspeptidase [Fusarium avenaceum]|nr:gamma-glutamyltranspeptidase [Fusarium avenaceum]
MPLPTSSIYEPPSAGFTGFPSRRSVVHSTEGMVAAPQPHAAKCGLEVLRAGGNAADAAVAVAAGLNVTEPVSTGIGGDMFLLYFDAATKQVKSLNGSGRSGAKQTLETIRKSLKIPDGKVGEIPTHHVHAATVPGAAAGWVDTVERFGSGKLSLSQILEPAIKLAENGFPLTEIASHSWQAQEKLLRNASPNYAEMLKKDPSAKDGVRAPRPGEVFRNPTLAETFRTLATEGKKGFYTGRIAEEIVKVVKDLGGYLELDDLKHHLETGTQNTDPISVKFRGQGLTSQDPNGGVELWEHPPNGQGIVALMALGIIEQLEKQGKIPTFKPEDHNSTVYLHAIIEALRLGFTDASWYVTDPDTTKVPTYGLISPEYLAERAKIFDASKAHDSVQPGNPDFVSPALRSSDTVYFTVTDAAGNAASFINSNYAGFGTAIVPKGCGFTLQNRGANFSLDEKHPNKLEPRKRPYHTIIPGMATNISDGSLHSAFGVMGGYNQPQGTVQVLLNQVLFGLNPQQALDAPRICIGAGMPDEGNVLDWTVHVEEGIPDQTVEELKKLGHNVVVLKGWKRAMFGRGQIIRYTVDPDGTPVWSAGSDPRADGAAYPQ